MGCRCTEITNLEEDKVKMENAIEKLVSALDKGKTVGDECELVDQHSKMSFRTRNILKLSTDLKELNQDGQGTIALTIAGMNAGLTALDTLLIKYKLEDSIYHAIHMGEGKIPTWTLQ